MPSRTFPTSRLLTLLVYLLLAVAARADAPKPAQRSVFDFPATGVTFRADFDGARLSDAALEDSGEYRIVIRPENTPINNSAWYAFQVSATTPQTITIKLAYENGSHRYRPKVSTDGKTWRPLAADCYKSGKASATLRVEVGPTPLWVCAQEQVGTATLNRWMDKIAELPFVEEATIGRSVEGRSLRQLTIRSGEPDYAVAIVGRQHPPEITGTIALMEFVDTITGPSDLALQFRSSFEVLVVPLMNPDGVADGNWRHNHHGVDLNRDWGPFAQPETRAVRDSILRYREESTPKLLFFLDFHSTQHDVFYVQTGKEPVWHDGFSGRWLQALGERLPDYKIRLEPNSGTRPLSKVWARTTMKIPAVIYEVGDNTDRALIRTVARASAEEMMRLLLEEVESETAHSNSVLQQSAAP